MRDKNGKFQKGHQFGGRPKGSSQSTKMRNLTNELNEKTIQSLLADFESLTKQEKIKILSVTLKHSVPHLQAIEASIEHDTPQSWFELSNEIKAELIKSYFND